MKRRCVLLAAVLLTLPAAQADPQFEEDRVTVQAQSWQYTQVLTYDYTSGSTNITDVDSGERTASRYLRRNGWIGFFLYDYTVGFYTEELIAGHDEIE